MRHSLTALTLLLLTSCANMSQEDKVKMGAHFAHGALHVILGDEAHGVQQSFPAVPEFNGVLRLESGGKNPVRKSGFQPQTDTLGSYTPLQKDGKWRGYYGRDFWTNNALLKDGNGKDIQGTRIYYVLDRGFWAVSWVGKAPLTWVFDPKTQLWGWVDNIHDPSAKFQAFEKTAPKENQRLIFSAWFPNEGRSEVAWDVLSSLGGYWDGDTPRNVGKGRHNAKIVGGEVRWYNAPEGHYDSSRYIPNSGTNDDYNFRRLRLDDWLRNSVVNRLLALDMGFIDWHGANEAWIGATMAVAHDRGAVICFNGNDKFARGCVAHCTFVFRELWDVNTPLSLVKDLVASDRSLGAKPLIEVQGDNPQAGQIIAWCVSEQIPVIHVHSNYLKVNGRDTLDHTPFNLSPILIN